MVPRMALALEGLKKEGNEMEAWVGGAGDLG